MNTDKLRACNKKVLENLAKKKKISGWHTMTKDDLVAALAHVNGKSRRPKPSPSRTRARIQKGAARNSSASSSAEEQVERSKYDVGVPTKDLSARAPKHLPSGYGKDRIVVMVRDPYWLHAYWEITRQSISRAE